MEEAHQAVSRRNYQQAERLFRRSSVLLERAFGPEHFTLAYVLNTQGSLLLAQGATRASLPPLERAVKIAEHTGDTNLWFYLSTLAGAEFMRDEEHKSQRLFRRAIAERERTGTPEDEVTAVL